VETLQPRKGMRSQSGNHFDFAPLINFKKGASSSREWLVKNAILPKKLNSNNKNKSKKINAVLN
jgi:hypothetical protein